jgi:hypothetical protein
VTLEGCTVSGNLLSYGGDTSGGGICVNWSASLVLAGGSVSGNTARTYGGGVMSYGQLSATDVVVSGNSVTATSSRGGGICCENYTLQLVNCTVSSNTSGGNGGGLWTSNSASLSGCTVELNESGGYGGAWYVYSGSPSLQNSQVRNNSATTVGGVWVESGSVSVSGTLFCGNGVNINGSYTNGGGNQLNGQCDPFCPGDSNGDTYIDAQDISEVLADWGPCGADQCYSDFNGDGIVNGADLTYVLAGWGRCRGW